MVFVYSSYYNKIFFLFVIMKKIRCFLFKDNSFLGEVMRCFMFVCVISILFFRSRFSFVCVCLGVGGGVEYLG